MQPSAYTGRAQKAVSLVIYLKNFESLVGITLRGYFLVLLYYEDQFLQHSPLFFAF